MQTIDWYSTVMINIILNKNFLLFLGAPFLHLLMKKITKVIWMEKVRYLIGSKFQTKFQPVSYLIG